MINEIISYKFPEDLNNPIYLQINTTLTISLEENYKLLVRVWLNSYHHGGWWMDETPHRGKIGSQTLESQGKSIIFDFDDLI